jgi:hypothetical protein
MKRLATGLIAVTVVLPWAALATEPLEPSLPAIQKNIFSPRCAQSFCHGESMQMGLDLRPGQSFSFLVDVPALQVPSLDRVEPFAPDDSYLVCKIEDCPGNAGGLMPVTGAPLTEEEIGAIREWILMGAPEFPGIAVEGDTWGRVKSMYR